MLELSQPSRHSEAESANLRIFIRVGHVRIILCHSEAESANLRIVVRLPQSLQGGVGHLSVHLLRYP